MASGGGSIVNVATGLGIRLVVSLTGYTSKELLLFLLEAHCHSAGVSEANSECSWRQSGISVLPEGRVEGEGPVYLVGSCLWAVSDQTARLEAKVRKGHFGPP